MDGNRRWAHLHNLSERQGHSKGLETLVEITKQAAKIGVKHLTAYALSSENYKSRGATEIKNILSLINEAEKKYLPDLKKEGFHASFIGNSEDLPSATKLAVNKITRDLSRGKGLNLNIALNYGSRQELVQAAKSLVDKKAPLTEEALSKGLYTGSIPDPDLIIRAGGQKRLSNFLLWQAAYCELFFTDTLWPDFSPEEFNRVLQEFLMRKRNFGS